MDWGVEMLFYKNLEELIFHRHEMFDVDELVVLSGYVGPQPVSRLQSLPFSTVVIYGMYGSDSISEKLHNKLNSLSNLSNSMSIRYSQLPVHSKCYIWRKNKKIVTALLGSANFSVSGLSSPYKEVLAETTFDTFDPLNQYLEVVLENCIDCTDINIKFKRSSIITTPTAAVYDENPGVCIVSLLDRKNEVPKNSGLNWGLSKGHTTSGDAYIRISKKDLIMKPLLFPPKQLKETQITKGGKRTRQNDAIEFIWDDGNVMEGILEGTQEIEGIIYPKQICSSPQKKILGMYLRERLGVDIDHLITKDDLIKYGRTTIDMSLQGEGIYYMDFSV